MSNKSGRNTLTFLLAAPKKENKSEKRRGRNKQITINYGLHLNKGH